MANEKVIVERILELSGQGKFSLLDDLKALTGYAALALQDDGKVTALHQMAFTTAIIVGVTRIGYERRYCYEHFKDALQAFLTYTGEGDPSGPWIKEKPSERLGPGAI